MKRLMLPTTGCYDTWKTSRRGLATCLFYLLHFGFILFLTLPGPANAIDCFKCVSVNGDNPACEDPFHNNYSSSIYESPCMGGRKGRNGLFPATACVKLSGTYDGSPETIMVRGCALDSGTLTTDTEFIRMSHCGGFYYDDRYVRGCVQSCQDGDGCNEATRTVSPSSTSVSLACLLSLLLSALASSVVVVTGAPLRHDRRPRPTATRDEDGMTSAESTAAGDDGSVVPLEPSSSSDNEPRPCCRGRPSLVVVVVARSPPSSASTSFRSELGCQLVDSKNSSSSDFLRSSDSCLEMG